jgi:hypothetical protein
VPWILLCREATPRFFLGRAAARVAYRTRATPPLLDQTLPHHSGQQHDLTVSIPMSGLCAMIICLAGKQWLRCDSRRGCDASRNKLQQLTAILRSKVALFHLAEAIRDVGETLTFHFYDSFHIVGT